MKNPVVLSLFSSSALALMSCAPIAARASGAFLAFDAASALCRNGECQPVVSQIAYAGRSAYRLTDGKSEAVVVPSLGRVMRWGRVGGPNLLWNASAPPKASDAWKNYGGDKTWLSPQSSWKVLHGNDNWPPDPAFDGTSHTASVLSGGGLKLVSNVSPRTGVRLERLMSFNAKGEFTIEQTAIKTAGAPIRVGLWSISQSDAPDAVFIPASPTSPYRDGFYKFAGGNFAVQSASIRNDVFALSPRGTGGGTKFGVDAPVSSIVAVKNGLAWLEQSAKPAGQYPDGADGAGFPTEIYVNGDPKANYVELELLGPLVNLFAGMKMTHTVKWSLHDLPSKNVDDPQTRAAVEALLK